jgi:argininosuccinate lyase
MMRSLKVKKANMERAASRGYILATDLADYLVLKGETFRSAHGTIAKLISYAISTGKQPGQLILSEYQRFSPLFDDKVYSITIASSIAARNIKGGTSPHQVAQALARAKEIAGK